MKLKILILLIAISFVSCFETENAEIKKTDYTVNGSGLYIYIIDSCEYLGLVYGFNSDKLTHKGNCKFCKARNLDKTKNPD
jgi:hypothetical protein